MSPRYVVTTSVIAVLLLFIAGYFYIDYVDQQSNRRWCGLVTLMDGEYKEHPPQTTTGKGMAEEIDKLHHEFECK